MNVTLEEVKEFLASQQIVLPDSLLSRMIARIDKYSDCFVKHGYDENDVYFIYMNLLTMLSLFQADGRIRSQGAPNGASRSFEFGALGQRWKALSSLLRELDPQGCILGLIPPDPDQRANCALFVSPGASTDFC